MTLHAARTAAARARLRHDRYLDHLVSQGGPVTVEQRATLADLKDAYLSAWQAAQDAEIALYRAHGIEVAA